MIKEVFELGDDLFLANRVSERVPLLQVVIGQNAIEETDACSRMTLMDSKQRGAAERCSNVQEPKA